MNAPFNFWATNALTDQPLRAFILGGGRNNRRFPRRILRGAEQPPVPAENSIEFGAAISEFRFPNCMLSRATHWRIQLNSARRFRISDFRLDYRARDPFENSMEIWRGELPRCIWRGDFDPARSISIRSRFRFQIDEELSLRFQLRFVS